MGLINPILMECLQIQDVFLLTNALIIENKINGICNHPSKTHEKVTERKRVENDQRSVCVFLAVLLPSCILLIFVKSHVHQ